MSMHLVGPWLSTTSGKKRKEKVTKAKEEQLQRDWKERNIRLVGMGLPKETYEQFLEWVYGKGKKTSTKETHRPIGSKTYARPRQSEQATSSGNGGNDSVNICKSKVSGSDSDNTSKASETKNSLGNAARWVTGPCSSKPSPVYTGEKIIGIATMHKSNLVPIFSDDEAKEVARMRR